MQEIELQEIGVLDLLQALTYIQCNKDLLYKYKTFKKYSTMYRNLLTNQIILTSFDYYIFGVALGFTPEKHSNQSNRERKPKFRIKQFRRLLFHL